MVVVVVRPIQALQPERLTRCLGCNGRSAPIGRERDTGRVISVPGAAAHAMENTCILFFSYLSAPS